jgi:hypothetical protein
MNLARYHSYHAHADLTWAGLGVTLFYFATFYMSWSIANFYFSRFVYADVIHRELIFFHMVGVLLMVVNVTMGMVR